MVSRAGVGGHARRRRDGTLVEHAGEARRLTLERVVGVTFSLASECQGLTLLGVAQPERCQRGSEGG